MSIATPYITTSKAATEPESLFWLEKGTQGRTTVEDISDALGEYERNYNSGNASKAEIMTLHRAFPDSPTYKQAAIGIQKMDMVEPLVIGGPASVELIDREGHLITTPALEKAFNKFMDNQRTRNVMVLHSDVQVGWALPAYISKGGMIYKSGVGDKGLFFICELRDDTAIAKKVAEQINNGLLKSYSIAGSATKVQNMKKGLTPYMQVDEMELAEVTVCEKGVNQGASFDILKAELPQTGKVDKDQCGYRDATAPETELGINCGHCKYFNAERKTCDVVVGDIQPGDYCRLFEACEEGSQPHVSVHRKIVIMRSENTGKINFQDSFSNWMEKEKKAKDPLKSGESFATLNNFAGRDSEHHRLLQEYGFPSEVPLDSMRYTPVVETETDDDGKPIHIVPPWVVNEAGEFLGDKLDEDAPTFKKSIDIFTNILQKKRKPLDKAPDALANITGAGQFDPSDPSKRQAPPQTPPENQYQIGSNQPQTSTAANVPTANVPTPNTGASTEPAGGQRRQRQFSPPSGEDFPIIPIKDAPSRTGRRTFTPEGTTPSRKRQFSPPIDRPYMDSIGREPAKGRQARVPVEEQPQREGAGFNPQAEAARRTPGDKVFSSVEPQRGRGQAALAREKRGEEFGGMRRGADKPLGRMKRLFRAGQRGAERWGERQSDRLGRGMSALGRGRRRVQGGVRDALSDAYSGAREGAANEPDKLKRRDFLDVGDRKPSAARKVGRAFGLGGRRSLQTGRGAYRGGAGLARGIAGRQGDDQPRDESALPNFGRTPEEMKQAYAERDRERVGGVGQMGRGGYRIGRGIREFGRGAVRGGTIGRENRERDAADKTRWQGRGAREGGRESAAESMGRKFGVGARVLGRQAANIATAPAKVAGAASDAVGAGVQEVKRVQGERKEAAATAQRRQERKQARADHEKEVYNLQMRGERIGEGAGAFRPSLHEGLSASEKHDDVGRHLADIGTGRNLSPKDWMSVIHHLSQNQDGQRFANFHDIDIPREQWHGSQGGEENRISASDMRGHIQRMMDNGKISFGEHGGEGQRALDSIMDKLENAHKNRVQLPMQRLNESRAAGLDEPDKPATPEPSEAEQKPANISDEDWSQFRQYLADRDKGKDEAADQEDVGAGAQRFKRPMIDPETGKPIERGKDRRPDWAKNREPIKYAVENDIPIHKIFAKAFGLTRTRR